MSKLELERIATRDAQIGDALSIRRALPNPQHRMIGAWCFLDQAGPVSFAAGQGMRVGPHPHIGLQTFTWQIEGETLHRDSLGYAQAIRPGEVNLMTAGRGIAHSETQIGHGALHLAQLWIALPDPQRFNQPNFAHHPELPRIEDGGFVVTVLVGEALGAVAPPEVFTPLVGLDLAASAAAATTLPLDPQFEYGVLVLEGEARVAGEALAPGTLLYLGRSRSALAVHCDARTRLLLLGGEPFGEPVLLWWNFVARTQDELVEATHAWNSGDARFGPVRGDDGARLVAPDIAGLKLRPPR